MKGLKKIIKMILERNRGVIVAYIMVIIGGIMSMTSLPTEFFPNFGRPTVETTTFWRGASPSDIEKYVTKPLEEAISEVDGVINIESTSLKGVSTITSEFNYGTDPDIQSIIVQNKVSEVIKDLPQGIDEVPVSKDGKRLDSVISFNVFGDDIIQVTEYSKNIIKEQLEGIPGVNSIEITGSIEEEIEVAISIDNLNKYELSIKEVEQRVAMANSNIPVGEIEDGREKLSVGYSGDINSLEGIKKIVIKNYEGKRVLLEEIATIGVVPVERNSIYSVNGREGVSINVIRDKNEDFLKLSLQVRERIEELQLPIGIEIEEGDAPADIIEISIDVLKNNGIIGLILAVGTLYLFLRNISASIIIGLGIPVSFIGTFLALKVFGISLNMMTLMGLSLAVGMLVDNSVVVIDSIESSLTMGYSKKDSVERALERVVTPIFSATLTSIIVFLPIILVGGMSKELFGDLAFSIVISLFSSLIVSLTLIPLLALVIMKPAKKSVASIEYLKGRYRRVLKVIIIKKLVVVISTVVLAIFTVIASNRLDIIFLPDTDEGYYGLSVETPKNLTLKSKGLLTQKIDDTISSSEYTKWYNKEVNNSGIYYSVALVENRNLTAMKIRDLMREEIGSVDNAKLNYFLDAGMGSEKAIELYISSKNTNLLKDNMGAVISDLSEVGGLTDITSTYYDMIPELDITFNRENLSDYGIDETSLNESIAIQLNGITSTHINTDDTLQLTVRVDKSKLNNIEDIEKLYIDLPNNKKVRLSDIANLEYKSDLIGLYKNNEVLYFNFSANVIEGENIRMIQNDLKEKLMSQPIGIEYSFMGEARDQGEVMSTLLISLFGAIGLVYMVLVIQFNSLVLPLIIMGTIPLSLVGVIFSLIITKTSLDVMVMIGVIILCGIIVNNALVLLESIIELEETMSIEEAIIEGGASRLRPILITTFTTILGMLPMTLGIGQGSEVYKAMARGVSGGLLVSTLLTLVVIPVIYYSYRKFQLKYKAINTKLIEKF